MSSIVITLCSYSETIYMCKVFEIIPSIRICSSLASVCVYLEGCNLKAICGCVHGHMTFGLLMQCYTWIQKRSCDEISEIRIAIFRIEAVKIVLYVNLSLIHSIFTHYMLKPKFFSLGYIFIESWHR